MAKIGKNNALTDVASLKVGHYTDTNAASGVTVVICGEGAVTGVDVRGSAPGTRETDLLAPSNLVEKAQAVMLSGGSVYGLAAADGVVRWRHLCPCNGLLLCRPHLSKRYVFQWRSNLFLYAQTFTLMYSA